MRINRTFSIPVELVHELRKKHNQSETVTRALRKYFDQDASSDTISQASTRQLMGALHNRSDIDPTMKKLLLHILSK